MLKNEFLFIGLCSLNKGRLMGCFQTVLHCYLLALRSSYRILRSDSTINQVAGGSSSCYNAPSGPVFIFQFSFENHLRDYMAAMAQCIRFTNAFISIVKPIPSHHHLPASTKSFLPLSISLLILSSFTFHPLFYPPSCIMHVFIFHHLLHPFLANPLTPISTYTLTSCPWIPHFFLTPHVLHSISYPSSFF